MGQCYNTFYRANVLQFYDNCRDNIVSKHITIGMAVNYRGKSFIALAPGVQ